jgi:cytochrome b subunit of formate dehydrogenase
MKRIVWMSSALVFGALMMFTSIAFAQGGVGGGFPSPSEFLSDAVLLARVIPFVTVFGIAFGVWQAKFNQRIPKSSPNAPSVIRHDFGSVVAHWTNGLGFIVGMLTGAIVLKWIQGPSDLRFVFQLHYVGAGLVIFGVASHVTQHIVAGGLGLIPCSFKDVREGLAEVIEYSGVFGPAGAALGIAIPKAIRQPIAEILLAFGIQPPKRMGKYLPAEKVFSYVPWFIIVTVMVVTGLVKTFRYLYPVSPEFVAQMTSWHDLFTALVVIMLAIHIAAVTLAPRNWPLLVSMFTTKVSRKHVERWHPDWFKQLTAAEQNPPQTAGAAVTTKTEQAKA